MPYQKGLIYFKFFKLKINKLKENNFISKVFSTGKMNCIGQVNHKYLICPKN